MERYLIKKIANENYNVIDTKYKVQYYCRNDNLKNLNPYFLSYNKPRYKSIERFTSNLYYISIKYKLNNDIYYTDRISDIEKLEEYDYIKIEIKQDIYTTPFKTIIKKEKYYNKTFNNIIGIFVGQKDKLIDNHEYIWIYENKNTYHLDNPNEIVREIKIEPLSKFDKIIHKIYNNYSLMIAEIKEKIKNQPKHL
jgi:hypothetical protein